jgi:hypothetical protein
MQIIKGLPVTGNPSTNGKYHSTNGNDQLKFNIKPISLNHFIKPFDDLFFVIMNNSNDMHSLL